MPNLACCALALLLCTKTNTVTDTLGQLRRMRGMYGDNGDLLQLYCFSALFLLMNRCSGAVAVAISTGLQETANITMAYA